MGDIHDIVRRLERCDYTDANHFAGQATEVIAGQLFDYEQGSQEWQHWHRVYHGITGALHGSLDGARKLHDELIPDWAYLITGLHATVYDATHGDCTSFAEPPAAAWTAAILKAWAAQQEGQGDE